MKQITLLIFMLAAIIALLTGCAEREEYISDGEAPTSVVTVQPSASPSTAISEAPRAHGVDAPLSLKMNFPFAELLTELSWYDSEKLFIPGYDGLGSSLDISYTATGNESSSEIAGALYSRLLDAYIEGDSKDYIILDIANLQCVDILGDESPTEFSEYGWRISVKPEYLDRSWIVKNPRVDIKLVGCFLGVYSDGEEYTTFRIENTCIIRDGNVYTLLSDNPYGFLFKKIHNVKSYERLYVPVISYTAESDISIEEAVNILVDQIMAPLTEVADDRAFVVLSYTVLDPYILGLGEYLPEDPYWRVFIEGLCGENSWYVEPWVSGKWEGIYSPEGHSYSMPENMRKGFGLMDRVLVKDGLTYTLYSIDEYKKTDIYLQFQER